MGYVEFVIGLENDSLGQISLQVAQFLPLFCCLPVLLQGKEPLGSLGGLGWGFLLDRSRFRLGG